MTTKFTAARVTAIALVLASLVGCGQSKSAAPTPTSSTSTASETPSATPTETSATPSTSHTPVLATRTAAQLTKALMALTDLPPGFSVEPEDSADEGDDLTVSSKDTRCKRLVALSNADNPPGSKASAYRSFSAGEQGPFIDESLDAMGSAAAVQNLQRTLRQAVTSCRSLTLTVPGQGRSPIAVREVSAPKAGANPVAVRYSATSGPLEGLEVTMVTTGVQDVVVSMTVVAGVPEDIDGATATAVEKASKTLGVKSGT